MAVCKIFHHNGKESIKAGLAWKSQLACGWVPVVNANKFMPAGDMQGIFELEKSGHIYCDSKQLMKIIEEHLTLKMVSDGRNHF